MSRKILFLIFFSNFLLFAIWFDSSDAILSLSLCNMFRIEEQFISIDERHFRIDSNPMCSIPCASVCFLFVRKHDISMNLYSFTCGFSTHSIVEFATTMNNGKLCRNLSGAVLQVVSVFPLIYWIVYASIRPRIFHCRICFSALQKPITIYISIQSLIHIHINHAGILRHHLHMHCYAVCARVHSSCHTIAYCNTLHYSIPSIRCVPRE